MLYFCRFLAGEKAQKEIFNVRGASGTKPCISRKNVFHFIDETAYLKPLACTDPALLDRHNNESIYDIVDLLRASKPIMNKTKFDELQKALGVNYDKETLLFDDDLRLSVLKPVDHCLRDWMHTLI